MSETLGTLTKVDPRTVWPDEARNFTPWLAKEENLDRLADTIRMELELEGTSRVSVHSTPISCVRIRLMINGYLSRISSVPPITPTSVNCLHMLRGLTQ